MAQPQVTHNTITPYPGRCNHCNGELRITPADLRWAMHDCPHCGKWPTPSDTDKLQAVLQWIEELTEGQL